MEYMNTNAHLEMKLAEANKRIAELEREKSVLQSELDEADEANQVLANKMCQAQASNNDLREAGQALIDRWDTPNWKDAEHTGIFIDALRKALSATPAESLQAK